MPPSPPPEKTRKKHLWVPVVELADQRQRLCPGRPLAVPRADLALVLATVEAVLQVAWRKGVDAQQEWTRNM
eukprot:364567-Chlamydomonas_euryale.AAC.1